MPVLSDKWIKKTAKTKKMITPFVDKQVRKGKISFGIICHVIHLNYSVVASTTLVQYSTAAACYIDCNLPNK